MAAINLIHGDCMDFMKEVPDKHFELAIVDPPYGLNKGSMKGSGKLKKRILNTSDTSWDIAPGDAYFEELFRVSKNQIIWGGNYFRLPPSRGIICWDKKQKMPTFSRWEYAWTSFYMPAKMIELVSQNKNKIHPTEKPVALYEWLLRTYAHPGDKIIDTHGGSMSIAMACYNLGFALECIEGKLEYYEKAVKRFQEYSHFRINFTPHE